MQAIVAEACLSWNVDEVWVGASGNFTIERVLADKQLHSNDVTLYSCAVGWYLAGDDFRLEIRDDFREEWGWLKPFMGTTVLCRRA